MIICFLSDCWSTTPPAFSTVTAGQTGDDNIDHCDHTTDNGMANGTDGIDDTHEAATDGAEDALDLEAGMLVYILIDRWKQMGFTYARDDSTHIEDEELFLGMFCTKVLVYFGLEVRVESELEEACVWTVGSLKGCMLKTMK